MNELNERIEQLAEEADEYAEQTVHYYQGQFDGLTWEGKIKQTRDTKFAELIVRECLEACSRANEIRHFVPPGQQQVVLDCMREIETTFRS